jgi:hypothetical protein
MHTGLPPPALRRENERSLDKKLMGTTVPGRRTVTDDYFQLVREFPVRPIRGRAEYETAGRMLNRLLGRPDGKLTSGARLPRCPGPAGCGL